MSTSSIDTVDRVASAAPDHPLTPLSAAEIRAVKRILDSNGLLAEHTKFAHVALEEPPKDAVLAFQPGDPIDRRARVLLLDRATAVGTSAVVSITDDLVLQQNSFDAAVDGQMPVVEQEFEDIEGYLLDSPEWIEAIRKRDLDPGKVRGCPLSAGVFGHEDEVGRRMVRVAAFYQHDTEDLPWAHPIDGLVAYVDLTQKRVVKVIDHQVYPLPSERAEWNAPAHAGPPTELKALQIIQPDGPTFQVDGNEITWANWKFRFGFDTREGMTLHQISFRDGDVERPIIYRASIAEMVVPYADPSPVRFWQNYFDQGEYLFGQWANSLELGCDCLGDITYFDVAFADDNGDPKEVKKAICLHEEDYGVLWKHSDMYNGQQHTERSRRLVISYFLTAANYDYGFYWYLYLDGTIELEAKATGIVFASAERGPDGYATATVAPGLGAPYHQHMFSVRLDMTVDGTTNTVEEVDAIPVPMGPENPWGNAFRAQKTKLTRESEAARTADNLKARTWHITNPNKQNRLGQNVGYALFPEGQPVLLADPASSIASRAAFATKHLWVTKYEPSERYPAGELVNQHPGGAGLPAFVAQDRNIDGEDIVVWHTFGLTHVPRAEDWPVMPVDYTGFKLKPVGFFDRSPCLHISTGGSHGARSTCCQA